MRQALAAQKSQRHLRLLHDRAALAHAHAHARAQPTSSQAHTHVRNPRVTADRLEHYVSQKSETMQIAESEQDKLLSYAEFRKFVIDIEEEDLDVPRDEQLAQVIRLYGDRFQESELSNLRVEFNIMAQKNGRPHGMLSISEVEDLFISTQFMDERQKQILKIPHEYIEHTPLTHILSRIFRV